LPATVAATDVETVVFAEATKERASEAIAEAIIEDQEDMRSYVCITCGWIYNPAEGDPENGIPPGTPFSNLPDDWTCPACGVGKERFEPER
jgi:rubredoxin